MESLLQATSYSEMIESQWSSRKIIGSIKTREGKTKRESWWEATRSNHSWPPPGNLPGNFITRSDGRFTFFQPPICAREAKWEHFKDGKSSREKQSRRQWGGQTSSYDGRVPSRTSFYSHPLMTADICSFYWRFFYQTKNVIEHTTVSCLISRKLHGAARNGAEKWTSALCESTRKFSRKILAWNILSPSGHTNAPFALYLEDPICNKVDGYCRVTLYQRSCVPDYLTNM